MRWPVCALAGRGGPDGLCRSHHLPRTARNPGGAGDRVAILGIGGLGHLGVQFASAIGFEAIGNFGSLTGYAAFDIGDHAVAERRFRLALWCADTAGSWELRASTLADMARKMAYIGHPDGGLSLIELPLLHVNK